MPDYLSVVHGRIAQPGASALSDCQDLANQCLRQLEDIEKAEAGDNRKRFPPRLLILLASPAYLSQSKAQQLLEGVYGTFLKRQQESPVAEDEQVKLIGSTVAAVFFDCQVHPQGALLICLASRLITAQVSFGPNARQDPEGAVQQLLDKFKIRSPGKVDPNPLANRRIITFMPGCNQEGDPETFYPAPKIHHFLYRGVQGRIRLVGGVSSANDPNRNIDGLQFAQGEVMRDAVVAASIKADVPVGVSLNDGLESTNRILQVTSVAEDKRTIHEFDGVAVNQEFGSRNLMLAKLSADDERIVDIPLAVGDNAVQVLRQVKQGDYFDVLRVARPIKQIMKQGIEQATQRVYAKRPAAALILACKMHLLATDGVSHIGHALRELECELGGPCLGGFFDGELGVDETGRSRLTNGGIAFAVFGDELRERTPLYQGVSAVTRFGSELFAGFELSDVSSSETMTEAIGCALKIVDEAGFPGAMISMKQFTLDRATNRDKYILIGKQACGLRFSRIVDVTRRWYESDDVLALVARTGDARFVADSTADQSCDPVAIGLSGAISQYVLPLKRLDGSVFGTLQVDLGDLRNYGRDAFMKSEQARMLNLFGVVIGAGVHRIAQSLKTRIVQKLDEALKDSMSAPNLHEGLERFVKTAGLAFGADMAHLRLFEADPAADSTKNAKLFLETGYGPWFEVEKELRFEIPPSARSPISYAFNADKPQVVNDLTNDPAWLALRDEIPANSEWQSTLAETQSYAAVSFRNDCRFRDGGAISLGSRKQWFFLRFHEKALRVLSERLAFLTEHLRATTARDDLYNKKEFFFKQTEFLYNASPKWADQNLKDVRATLKNVTQSFRTSLKAEVASLYLWDRDRKEYVLRAEEGWKRKGWVDAAGHGKHSGWIGLEAINREPIYRPDLYAFYKQVGYDHPEGIHAQYMFGKSLSENFKVEVIGLPLRIGPSKKGKFGVLTLYRRVRHGQESSGFATTDVKVLESAAYNTAGLVNAVLKQRDQDWAEKQDRRRERVVKAVSSADEADHFEASVCREVLCAYEAAEVSFYRVDDAQNISLQPTWIAGFRNDERSYEPQRLTALSTDHTRLIQQTMRQKRGKPPTRVFLAHRECKGHSDPRALKIKSLVERACVPLLAEKKYRAALVIRWKLDPDRAFDFDLRQDPRHLHKLGVALGAIDLRREMKEQADRSQLAVQTAGIYVFQHAHRLGNATQSLYRIAQEISLAESESERRQKIQDLVTITTHNNRLIKWIIDFGQQVENPRLKPIVLRDLVERSWQEVRVEGVQIDGFKMRSTDVPIDISIKADLRLAKEVFVNLITNALKALKRKEQSINPPALQVSAVVSEDKERVFITFEDNGVGMTRDEVDKAMRGFVPERPKWPNPRHTGVGVLISRYLLQVQKGSLSYESEFGKGTKATVTLPLYRNGDRRK